jgi:hypothetical protein
MKKNQIILWAASLIITFLTIYLSNLLEKNYPITSTFGIEGKKVSYRFEKVHYGNDSVSILIRKDLNDLKGKLFWKNDFDNKWSSSELKNDGITLEGKLEPAKPLRSYKYFVNLYYKDKTYELPRNQKMNLVFYGKIPSMVNILKFLLLYIGLLLSIRTGLEYFNDSKNCKKFGVLVVILFMTLTVLINPLYLTYKFGFMNSSIPSINKLFPAGYIAITLLWVLSLIILFRLPKIKITPLVAALLSIIIFSTII